MRRHINLFREFSVPLIAGVIVAMTWANVDPAGYHHFNERPLVANLSFHFLSNELFMALFFGLAAVEITKSCLPGGDLNPFTKAVNPLLATLGGVVGPVALYFALNALIGSPSLARGWGIPTATDIALAWVAARIIFGADHPAVSYLLLLAVADDAIGLAIIAIFYPDPELPAKPWWLLLTALGMAVAYLMRRLDLRSYWPYIIAGGALSWTGLHHAHLHPALALAFIVPFLPHPKRACHFFQDRPLDHSTLTLFEHEWKVVVDFGLFLFGLSNAGIQVSAMGAVTWMVLVSLIAGKTIGISGFGWLAVRLGFPLPEGMKGRDLVLTGIIAGTGFTVALFVCGEAFTDPVTLAAAKMGALFSLGAPLIAFLLGRTSARHPK